MSYYRRPLPASLIAFPPSAKSPLLSPLFFSASQAAARKIIKRGRRKEQKEGEMHKCKRGIILFASSELPLTSSAHKI